MLLYSANKKIEELWPDVENRIAIVFQKRGRTGLAGSVELESIPVLIRVKRSQYGWYQARMKLEEGQKLESLRPMKNGRDYPEGQRVKALLRHMDAWLRERKTVEDVLRQFRQKTASRVRVMPIYTDGFKAIKAI